MEIEQQIELIASLWQRIIDYRKRNPESNEHYELEAIRDITDSIIEIRVSQDEPCRCSSRCGYEYTHECIPIEQLFWSPEKLDEHFKAMREKKLLLEKEREAKKQAELQLAREKKEKEEKELLEKLKKKYE